MKNLILALLAKIEGISSAVWDFIEPILASDAGKLLGQILPLAETIVASLAPGTQSGAEKRAAAATQIGMAQGYSFWKQGQDSDLLESWPAYEFLRVAARKRPRKNWPSRFLRAGGSILHGRMVALKNHGVWERLSRFGTPWPPFDFNSGMGLREIGRDEAESLGLLKPGDVVPSTLDNFNAQLQQSVRGLDDGYRAQLTDLFGDQIKFDEIGNAIWRGNVIGDLYRKATAPGSNYQQNISLGLATEDAVKKANAAGEDLNGYELVLSANNMRHGKNSHGDETEDDPTQRPLTQLDYELMPEVWRFPDAVTKDKKKDRLLFSKVIDGQSIVVAWLRNRREKIVEPKTFWIKVE